MAPHGCRRAQPSMWQAAALAHAAPPLVYVCICHGPVQFTQNWPGPATLATKARRCAHCIRGRQRAAWGVIRRVKGVHASAPSAVAHRPCESPALCTHPVRPPCPSTAAMLSCCCRCAMTCRNRPCPPHLDVGGNGVGGLLHGGDLLRLLLVDLHVELLLKRLQPAAGGRCYRRQAGGRVIRASAGSRWGGGRASSSSCRRGVA